MDTAMLVDALATFYNENPYFVYAMLPVGTVWVKAFIKFLGATLKIALAFMTMLGVTAGAVFAMIEMAGLG